MGLRNGGRWWRGCAEAARTTSTQASGSRRKKDGFLYFWKFCRIGSKSIAFQWCIVHKRWPLSFSTSWFGIGNFSFKSCKLFVVPTQRVYYRLAKPCFVCSKNSLGSFLYTSHWHCKGKIRRRSFVQVRSGNSHWGRILANSNVSAECLDPRLHLPASVIYFRFRYHSHCRYVSIVFSACNLKETGLILLFSAEVRLFPF